MKFDEKDLTMAMDDLATIPFFPSEEGSRGSVAEMLMRTVPSREALEWLRRAATLRFSQWPGIKGLLELLCERFPPADGVKLDDRTPETAYLDRCAEEYERGMRECKRLKAAGLYEDGAPPEVHLPKQLAAARRMPQ